jgi:hypothetical protein
MTQEVEHLLCKHEALHSNTSPTKKKKKKVLPLNTIALKIKFQHELQRGHSNHSDTFLRIFILITCYNDIFSIYWIK